MQIKAVVTAGIAAEMSESDSFNQFVLDSIHRHLSGDWGDISADDAAINAADPLNALSTYHSPDGEKVWIKQDGVFLTVLFPSEY